MTGAGARTAPAAAAAGPLDRRPRLRPLLQGALLVAYPALVYLGVGRLGPRGTALLLLGTLVLARAGRLRRDLATARAAPGLWVALLALLAASAVSGRAGLLLAYPVLVNAVLLGYFAATLRRGPPLVERFARAQAADLTAAEVRYCRSVTVAWCLFFALNGAAAAALAAFASRRAWALYTGGLAYLLLGALFAAEYVMRKARFGRFDGGLVDRALARVLGRREPAR